MIIMFVQDESDEVQHGKFSRRTVLLGAAQVLGLGAATARLYQLQVLDQSSYAKLSEQNRNTVQMLAPLRGQIVDRFGTVLAANTDQFQAVLVRSLAPDMGGVLRDLSMLIPLSRQTQDRIIRRALRQSPNLPVMITRDLNWEQFAQINLRAPRLPGIQTRKAGRRQYFHGDAVGLVVGYVGAVQRFALDDDPLLRLPGMSVGKSGVERAMEKRLRGVGGRKRLEVDAHGRIIREQDKTQPEAGRDVVLTIDTQLQRRVMQRLASEKRAAAVVIDVVTGEVVVMASVPSFDPQQIAKGITSPQWRKLRRRRGDPFINRAIAGQYPPGSTFKLVTALAALEAGLVKLDEKVQCPGHYTLAGHKFRCWRRAGHGAVDLHRALRESCDVYFYDMANRLGIRAIGAMAKRLGFAQSYDMGIAAQARGLIPDPEWKFGRFNKSWYGGETILAGIGQGYVLATPLQMAVMVARVASGRRVQPTLLRPEQGTSVAEFQPLDIAPKWLQAVRGGLIGAVNEPGGTGRRARLPLGEALIAGKTGTSQVSRRSSRRSGARLAWKYRDHALFVGYFPADAPRYAVSVVVEHGGGGGSVAAPLMRDITGFLLEADPAARPAILAPASAKISAGPLAAPTIKPFTLAPGTGSTGSNGAGSDNSKS